MVTGCRVGGLAQHVGHGLRILEVGEPRETGRGRVDERVVGSSLRARRRTSAARCTYVPAPDFPPEGSSPISALQPRASTEPSTIHAMRTPRSYTRRDVCVGHVTERGCNDRSLGSGDAEADALLDGASGAMASRRQCPVPTHTTNQVSLVMRFGVRVAVDGGDVPRAIPIARQLALRTSKKRSIGVLGKAHLFD